MASTRTSRRRARARIIGVGVLAVFVLMVYIALTATKGVPGTSRTSQKVAFGTVGALRVGDDVRIANIRVGSVSTIALQHGKPVVTMEFDGDRSLYKNATATINQRSPLGQAYVNVDPGTTGAGKLASNSVISTPTSSSAQDLTDVLDVLNPRTRTSLQQTVLQAGGGSAGHAQDLQDAFGALPEELPDLGTVARSLSTNNGADLTSLLSSTDSLAKSFAGQQQDISTLLAQTSATLQAVDVNGGKTLASILQQGPSTLHDLDAGLGSLQGPLASTHAAVLSLQPGAAALGQATPDVRGLLRESVTPLDKVPGVARQAVSPLGDLTTTMRDLKPLAPSLARTITTAATPLARLAPYAPEISQFFTYATDALHQGDAAGHWLRFYPIIESASLDGSLTINDPLVGRDAYPAPGKAATEKQKTPIGLGG